MIITRDTDYRQHLLDTQRSRMGLGERRSGVHVSDLVMCIRKAWAERVSDHILEVSDQTVLTWLRGLSHEALLTDGVEQVRSGFCFQCQTNYPYTPQLAESNSCPHCNDELLVGTIDWVTLEGIDDDAMTIDDFIPVEMKSTLKSSRKTLEDGDMQWFIDQIKSYMFMHGRDSGRICILHVMGDYSRGNPDIRSEGPQAELRVYRVSWENPQERADWGAELNASKQLVQGDELPPLDARSPRHSFICDYCIIGQRLPNGKECELYPWTADGIRKGSQLASVMSLEDIERELESLKRMAQKEIEDEIVQVITDAYLSEGVDPNDAAAAD